MRLSGNVSDLLSLGGLSESIVWLGAISFESRCTGSLAALIESGIRIEDAVAFDYPTNLSPRSEGEQSRALNRKELDRLLGRRVDSRVVHPYRYAEFIGELYRLSSIYSGRPGGTTFAVDVTCLTKIHTLAVSYWLLTQENVHRVILAYSLPEHYGNPSRNIWGKGKWLTTLVTRLDLDSTEPYSSTTAIAVLGHEGDRLRLALNEAEATEGLVVKVSPRASTPSPVDFVTDVQNAWLSLEIQNGIRRGFARKNLHQDEVATFSNMVSEYCLQMRDRHARVVLCPFGPKPFVFSSGYASLSVYPENTWLSYPIPSSYDVEYSTGYKHTMWLAPEPVATMKYSGVAQWF